jgi:hypothetical protein
MSPASDPIAEVLARVQQNQIKFIDLQFTDVVGIVKNVTIPAAELPQVLANGIWFDGSSTVPLSRALRVWPRAICTCGPSPARSRSSPGCAVTTPRRA